MGMERGKQEIKVQMGWKPVLELIFNTTSGNGVTLNGRLADAAGGGFPAVNTCVLLLAEGPITFPAKPPAPSSYSLPFLPEAW